MVEVKLEGLEEIKKFFTGLPEVIQNIADAEIEEGLREFVILAKRDAPADMGRLRGSIDYAKIGVGGYEVFAQSAYAAYMEFGTKGNYRPVPGAETIAAQFRGKGEGTFKQMVRAIVEWVKRKGIAGRFSTGIVKDKDRPGKFKQGKSKGRRLGSKIDQLAEDYAAAWPIVMSILKNGVKAHPYFFKQQGIVVPKIMSRINQRVKELT